MTHTGRQNVPSPPPTAWTLAQAEQVLDWLTS